MFFLLLSGMSENSSTRIRQIYQYTKDKNQNKNKSKQQQLAFPIALNLFEKVFQVQNKYVLETCLRTPRGQMRS